MFDREVRRKRAVGVSIYVQSGICKYKFVN